MINDQSLYFVFNGKKSSDFNVWCSGDGLYRLPERDVEYISVPGRNGDLVVDNGRWQNVAVTYSCFIPKNFREHYADLVSWLASQKGYGKLEDARHPEFYWLARMDADVDPKMVVADDSGTFTLTFNCKPQRFLKSGEIPVEIPCEPAADPATARRYWRLSQFEEYAHDRINDELAQIGYTTSEINALQFAVMPLDLSGLALESITKSTKIKGADNDGFFLFLCSFNPVDGPGQSDIYWEFYSNPNLALNEGGLVEYMHYAIVKKAFGLEIWWDDKKIGQDETYQFGTLVNPARFDAVPKFRVKLPNTLENMAGATTYLVGAGRNGIAIKWTADMLELCRSTITLDAETMDAYILAEDIGININEKEFVSLNHAVKFYGNRIVLKPGENTIRLDPMVAGCEIIPRWWSL